MDSRTNTLERWLVFMIGVVAGLIIVASMISSLGCSSSSPPCAPCPPPPDPEIIRDQVRACPDPGRREPVVLPKPIAFPVGASIVIINDWLADFADVVKARETILLEKIDSLEKILDHYRTPPPE